MNNSTGCLSKIKHYLSCCNHKNKKAVLQATCDCCRHSQTITIAYDEKSSDGSSTDIEITPDTVKIS